MFARSTGSAANTTVGSVANATEACAAPRFGSKRYRVGGKCYREFRPENFCYYQFVSLHAHKVVFPTRGEFSHPHWMSNPAGSQGSPRGIAVVHQSILPPQDQLPAPTGGPRREAPEGSTLSDSLRRAVLLAVSENNPAKGARLLYSNWEPVSFRCGGQSPGPERGVKESGLTASCDVNKI